MLVIPDSAFVGLAAHIVAQFRAYDSECPSVFEMFVAKARALRGAGWDHYSADAIVHHIRWHEHVDRGNRDFKINNNIAAAYARALIYLDPTFGSFFYLRRSPGTVPVHAQGTP